MQRFGDLSFTPAPVHSSSTGSVDMREITAKNRKIQVIINKMFSFIFLLISSEGSKIYQN